MKCPYCNDDNTHVLDSRPVDDNTAIRRRRQCDSCQRRFTTYEKVETLPMSVIKKDNTRQQYDRSKIEGGILRACYKRPVSADQVDQLVNQVENEIFLTTEREVSSTLIGEVLMKYLKDVDEVAYVRFASVYREFKDVGTFMEELKTLMDNKKK